MSLDPTIRDQVLAAVPSLRAFAISLCGNVDRADDLVQETLLRALANIHSFQPGTNMPAWLFTILRNLFRSEYRKRRREVRKTSLNDAVLVGAARTGAPIGAISNFTTLLLLAPWLRINRVGRVALSDSDARAGFVEQCTCCGFFASHERISQVRGGTRHTKSSDSIS